MAHDANQLPGSTPRSAYAVLGLLISINLLNYIDRYVLAAILPELEHVPGFFSAGMEDKQFWLGMLSSAFLLTYMIAAPILGLLADRFSRWLLIGIAVLVWSLASGASGLATSLVMMLITRIFVGIGEAAYGPAAPTLIADMFPVKNRGRMMAFFYMAIPVGSALGYIWGGQALRMAGDWRHAFYWVVPPGLILGMICLMLRDRRPAAVDAAPHATKDDYLELLRTPSYVLTTLGMTAMTFALGGIAYWMPKYLLYRTATPGMTEQAKQDLLASLNFNFGLITVAAGLSATFIGGWLGDKLRPKIGGSYFLVSGLGMLLGLPFFIAVLELPNENYLPFAWWLIFATEFAVFLNTGPTNTILANVTQPKVRATAYAINIFMIHALGDVISPPLMGLVNDRSGGNMNAGFRLVAGAILLSGIFWLIGTRFLKRDTDRITHLVEGAPHVD